MADESLTENTDKQEAAEEPQKEDIDTLKKALADEKARADANLAGWQRAQADFTNSKRRFEQEKEETIKSANTALVLVLLPILDDMTRALDCRPPELAKDCWSDGIALIERKFRTTLESQGLATIKAVGEPFDPRLHEAIKQDKGKEGIVIAEVEKGYMFRDKVIRPSKVVVGMGE